jgi:hypothetical protein
LDVPYDYSSYLQTDITNLPAEIEANAGVDDAFLWPLSIEENVALADLRLKSYPNPTSGEVTLSFILPDVSGVTISIYNVLGNQIDVFEDTYQAGVNTFDMDMSNYEPGVYFYKIETKFGFDIVRSIVQ